MRSPITYENLRTYAYSNDKQIRGDIRGIVIYFTGMGCDDRFDGTLEEGDWLAERNIAYLIPYGDPWAWMNRKQVHLADTVIDTLLDHYNLPGNTPIVSAGLSMGGHGSLLYPVHARHTPVACVANCPVCDLFYLPNEHPDAPSSFYSAFYDEPGTMEEILTQHTPLHLAEAELLPRIPYTIFQCTEDALVHKANHADRLVALLTAHGYDIHYRLVPDRGHCDLPPEDKRAFYDACAAHIDAHLA